MLRGWTNQDMDDQFQRLESTISRHIKKTTPCLEDFAYHWICPMQPPEHWHECLKKNKRYRRFKDCIGAIDGTHLPCTPPSHETARYWSRKGGTTFNVIAVCDFNLCFKFAASGYEDKYFRSADMENEDYVNDIVSHELHDEANEAIQSDLDFTVVDEYMDSLRNKILNQILLDHRGRGNQQGNIMHSEQEIENCNLFFLGSCAIGDVY
ncbi:hypothetical protein Vadar_021645 [Vaccinium darrowii]|uniref:Uncharacterized protein n=1 Tax=Vaccinium darrowii TaxID=229202 RepID=A0ACB7XBK2_9ERIC|nr:hypothetical protein Vadar_021645 [Vaccinium darrowii]